MIQPEHTSDLAQQVQWDLKHDRMLLLFGLGKEISPKEYAAIASWFPGEKSAMSRWRK